MLRLLLLVGCLVLMPRVAAAEFCSDLVAQYGNAVVDTYFRVTTPGIVMRWWRST